MGRWEPLPPGRSERWLVSHHRLVHVGLVVLIAAWIAVALKFGLQWLSLAFLTASWVVLVKVYVRRTRRWDAEHPEA
jgi:hypothetical protein